MGHASKSENFPEVEQTRLEHRISTIEQQMMNCRVANVCIFSFDYRPSRRVIGDFD
jgi:hypothetical protein